MTSDKHQPLRVLAFSSGNPDATYLAAGLLLGHPGAVRVVRIQGVGGAMPSPEVGRVLAELGLDVHDWLSQVSSVPPDEPVDVGLTVCVPT